MTTPTPELPKPSSVSVINSDAGSVELRDNYTADQMREYARAAIQQAAGAVPEGWKLVPVEPTKEMRAAGAVSLAMWQGASPAVAIWHEMLAASPSPVGREAGSSDHSVPCAGGGVTQWQPIETAPKWTPGTEREFVLLWCPNAYNVEHIKVGYVEAGGAIYSMYEATGEMGSEPQRYASHWMPFPCPPAKRSK